MWSGEVSELEGHASSCKKRPWECGYCGVKCELGEGEGRDAVMKSPYASGSEMETGDAIPPPYQQRRGNQLFSTARGVWPIKSLQFGGKIYAFEGSEMVRDWNLRVAPEPTFSMVGVRLEQKGFTL